jgi:hypothetical protein
VDSIRLEEAVPFQVQGVLLGGAGLPHSIDCMGVTLARQVMSPFVQSRETTTDCLFRAYSFSVAFTATYN